MYICEICGTKFSSDFTDESEAVLLIRITHGFARIFGRWPMARARYVLLLFFVTQISQMTQIFFVGGFCPTDFTDIHRFFFVGLFLSHRFHRFTQIFLRGIIFVPQISQIYTDFFESQANRFVRSQGVSVTTEQVASAKICE